MLKFRSIGLCFFGIWVLLSALATEPAFAQKKQKKVRKNRSDIIEVADDYFHNQEYYEAIVHYKKAFEYNPKDAYVQYRMGDCYRHMFNYTEAEGFYSKCIEFGPTWETPHPEYWYGLMLKNNGKYAEAKIQFEQFTKSFKPKAKEDLKYYTQAKLELEACDFAIKETQTPPKDYHLQLLPPPVNSKYSEYAPSFYLNDSTIAITSTRHTGKEDHKFTTMFGDAYSKSYRFEKNTEKWIEEKRDDNFFVINGDHNNGAGCFNKNKTKYYFTNCSTPDGTCGIYVSKLKEGKWHKPERLNDHINKPGTWNGQPSLNETDDTLYFVSKRPGGKGMHDIWVSNCTGRQEDSWIEPTNLGEHINTPFSELSPHHYHVEKTLFFSSNGKPGLGGLDIFVAHGDSFQTVVNLGVPFNSSKDDFYFNYGRHRGYLCSNRDGGIGSDDIYMFHIDKNQSVLAYLEVSEPVDSTKLAQNAADQNNVTEAQTGDEATARVEEPSPAAPPAEPNNPENTNSATAFVAASPAPATTNNSKNNKTGAASNPSNGAKNTNTQNKNKPATSKTNTSTSAPSNSSNQIIPPVVVVAPIITENGDKGASNETTSNARTEENASSQNTSTNNSLGNTSTTAQRSDGQPVAVKIVKATPAKAPVNPAAKAKVTTPAKTSDGKTAKSISVSGQVVDETNQPVADAENMLTEENGTVLKKSKTNQKGEFKYSNIPADKNYTIVVKEKGADNASASNTSPRKYAVKNLNVNASDLNPSKNLFENIYFDFDKSELRPEAKKVLDELYTYWSQHTDVQIEMNAYTDDWGESEYNQQLAEKRGQMGIDYLVQKGMDRSAIVLAAQGETNPLAPNMSLIGRQLNRRVEFSIVGGPGFVTNTMTYVLEPKNTLYSIAKKYNMTVEELKDLNGLTDESILAWRPLRVKKSDDASASIAPVTLEAMQRAFVATNGDSLQTATQTLDLSNPVSDVQLTPEEENMYQIYIVEPQNTMYSISRQFAMSVEELKSINGLSSNILRIGQKLKVKK